MLLFVTKECSESGTGWARPVTTPPHRVITGSPHRYGSEMTLHRDIYWLGRQWAVTGHGIQAVNKKLNMRFDVQASRIWEEDTDRPMRQLDWFDAEDFAEALQIARRLSQE